MSVEGIGLKMEDRGWVLGGPEIQDAEYIILDTRYRVHVLVLFTLHWLQRGNVKYNSVNSIQLTSSQCF